MIIIQIRGTSGSGKSTAMSAIMKSTEWDGVFVKGRKKPLYYRACDYHWVVLGHYESPCGGGDTIGSARAIYDLIRSLPPAATVHRGISVVLVEGLLLSEDVRWTTQLKEEGNDVRVLFLTTSLERCLRQIRSRRLEAGNEKPLNEDNTRNRVGVIERARVKLLERLGEQYCRRCSPEQSSKVIMQWLRQNIMDHIS